MYKKFISFLVLGVLMTGTVNAFSVENILQEQVDSLSGVALMDEQITLAKDITKIGELFINPHFPSLYDMYLNTENGVFLNNQFNADWNKNTQLSEMFPEGLLGISFDGNFATSRTMLAYSADKAVLSYNNGEAWSDITPAIDEEILFMDFGPYFNNNAQLYFITSSGLYRKSVSSDQINLVLAAAESGSVNSFMYYREQTSDAVFYVVNGNKILKTENFGNDFNEHEFAAKIVDVEIIEETPTTGYLMILTADNKLFYSDNYLVVRELTLPAEITKVYSAGEIINTDNGFYITYSKGDSWGKLNYDAVDTANVTEYDYFLESSLESLYVINNNTLYRDENLTETLSEYMTGLDQSDVYFSEGTVISKNLLEVYPDQFAENYLVNSATLSADGDLNGQTMTFSMTADGTNWEEVVLDEEHVFAVPGRDLRWKVVLATADTAVSPVLRSVSVDFGFLETEPPVDETLCAGFADVPANDPMCPAILYVQEQGIFAGYPDGDFKADQAINRAETVKVITEGFDIPLLADDGTKLGFSDVIVGEWYMGYLRTAKEGGVIEGYPNGTFKPEQTVNYVEMMKIFLETSGAELSTGGAEWYSKYVDFAKANQLVTYAQLDAGMKRGDVAQLFYQWSLR